MHIQIDSEAGDKRGIETVCLWASVYGVLSNEKVMVPGTDVALLTVMLCAMAGSVTTTSAATAKQRKTCLHTLGQHVPILFLIQLLN